MWHIARNGKKIGCLSEGDLIAHIKNNKVKASDLVWKEGMTDWTPVKEAGNFAQFFKAVPPDIKTVKVNELDVLDDDHVKSVAEKPRNSRLATFNKFCSGCGELLHQDAVVCPKCGVGQRSVRGTAYQVGKQTPNRVLAIVLCLILGTFGVHRFYVGQTGVGLVMLLCTVLSGFLLWPLMLLVNLVEIVVWALTSDADWEMQFGGEVR